MDACLQLLGGEGFNHVIVGAQLQPSDAIGHIAQGGEHDHRHFRLRPDALEHRKAIELGHHHVEHHHIGFNAAEQLQCFCAILSSSHLVALHRQAGFKDAANVGFVVRNQDLERLLNGLRHEMGAVSTNGLRRCQWASACC